MISKSALPINDPEIISFLKELKGEDLFGAPPPSPAGEFKKEFISCFEAWFFSDNGKEKWSLNGWEPFVTAGTTEAFQAFYLKKGAGEVYTFMGEYPFHSQVGVKCVKKLSEVPRGSGLILSYPFSATGNKIADFEKIMEYCLENDVEVMLDCALLAISSLKEINLKEYPCIKSVAFSLSKSFSSGRFRSGVLYAVTKDYVHQTIKELNEWSYIGHLCMNIHLKLMTNFSRDYLWSKYREKQLGICKNLNLVPSDTLLFGLSDNDEYKEFSRRGITNRVCITSILEANDG